MKVSVALLTKNGGSLFGKCLEAVCAQRLDVPFEILVIDSGSRDGTAELARANSRVRVEAIAPSEFQHGRTRNLAMRIAGGELVAFLTQDAVPANDRWLAAFVAFMDAHAEVAGAFGCQAPHEGADPLEALEVRMHFDSFGGHDALFRYDGAPLGAGERVRLHYFSNVNSCIRREAWSRVPFPEIDFGEDQAWARAVQDAGDAIAYVHDAAVRHSHDYGPGELFRRRYDEARFMNRAFGFALVPTWREAWRMGREHAAHFRAHLRSLAGRSRWGDRARASARSWASTLGRFAGTRLASREGSLHACLSLAERQRRG